MKRIDHVAIATGLPAAVEGTLASLFGLRSGAHERVTDQHTDAAFLHAGGGDALIELVSPSDSTDTGLRRFVDKRGTALHHVCFEVEDLAATLATLKSAGVPLVDEVPRRGARGHWVGFIHPRATGGVLFELCQPAQGDPT